LKNFNKNCQYKISTKFIKPEADRYMRTDRNRRTVYEVHTPTNALFGKLDKVLKFALKITSAFSYMFRSLSTTIIKELSLEPC